MARPRQVKKDRSSKPRVKTGITGRTKAGKRKVNFLGNETIRKNWDRKLTLAQNYENLGLAIKLKGRSGGTEKSSSRDPFTIHTGVKTTKLVPSEVKVVRDADGNILEVLDSSDAQKKASNPLNDPLNDLEDEEEAVMQADTQATSNNPRQKSVVTQLEAQAAMEEEQLAKNKKPRKQSSREEEWLETLMEKHGDDYEAMFRDRKLNPMQQSVGDIKKRVKKWKAKHGG